MSRLVACGLAFFLLWICTISALADSFDLTAKDWTIRIDPTTLQCDSIDPPGTIALSGPQFDLGPVDHLQHDATTASWHFKNIAVRCDLDVNKLSVNFFADRPATIHWPAIPAQSSVLALILPMFEGLYVPLDEARWRTFLTTRGDLDTTADLSMPFIGLRTDHETMTFIFADPFNNKFSFSEENRSIGTRFSHEVTPIDNVRRFRVLICRGHESPIEPARQYRAWLISQKQFVSMATKIKQTPHAARLLGAIQAYLWDANLLSPLDIRDVKAFCTKLKSQSDSDPFCEQLWKLLDNDAQSAVTQIAGGEWPNEYLKRSICVGLTAALQAPSLSEIPADTARADLLKTNIAALLAAFPGQFDDPADWGDGVSTKMLDALHDAGIDRACLTLGDLSMANDRPAVARRADELGFLLGPYDSYHSIHSPDEPNTWVTAQFDRELYETGPIVGRDGKKLAGFLKRGFKLSPLAARPYVEKRVNGLIAQVPFTSWFLDCDAFGEVYDDYSPAHRETQVQDAQARLDRLEWLSTAHGLVVGSEGGSAYAVPAIHFAHGIMTPVFGWGDPDFKDRKSKYFLGAWYPPEAPHISFDSVPCKPEYAEVYFDPRYRLPLYQAVFNDAVIATHEASYGSFKFSDQIQTDELLELLYNVPPLYQLNMAEWKKRRDQIKRHFDFFSPLHRELALEAMTDFEWLTPDRMVQRTTFADGTTIVANFSEKTVTVKDGNTHEVRTYSAQ